LLSFSFAFSFAAAFLVALFFGFTSSPEMLPVRLLFLYLFFMVVRYYLFDRSSVITGG
jgi:hypothetical protein